ncbi:hypothetical protein [Nocardioides sp. Soil796]|uniref:hypothetical protein n=1 Tax=Nocardioides sp. Soil796 TaxID=1736412 RepID=UPI0006FE3F07|nr:hypothetical protein [Nocardioides sp. Soil796]KQY55455.1 hypothetical protein ASD30_16235 [Nocardioides sp. Root140]KRF14513.1 hypothetical protein ASH02_09310 [Nocardioides sp. Soil796]
MSGLPGSEDLPQEKIALTQGLVTLTQTAAARASKMFITIGPDSPIWGGLYQGLYNTPIENPVSFLAMCTRGRACVDNPFDQPDCADPSVPTSMNRGSFLRVAIYALSPLTSGGVDAGLVARVPVNLVAFGSIPATATLTLRQPKLNGKLRPFTANIWDTNSPLNKGCDPNFTTRTSTIVEGKLEVTLSDLTVDGVPVDLGKSCRTESLVDLRMWNEGAYTPGGGGTLAAYDGLHGPSLGPLNSPYHQELDGQQIPASTGITIPPFTGCGVGGEDLSPIVSAMASGPNNPVRAVQSPMASFDELPLDDLGTCSNVCPKDVIPDVPANPPLPEGDE